MEEMFPPGQASSGRVAVSAGCRDLVGCMARALLCTPTGTFLALAGQSPLDHTSTSASMVGCGGFKAIFCFSLPHRHKPGFVGNRHGPTCFSVRFFLFFGSKSSKISHWCDNEKMTELLKKKP